MPSREVHHQDALDWLRNRALPNGTSILSAIPDVSEVGIPYEAWLEWFVEAARLMCLATPEEGLAVLTQTDIRKDGAWIDKSALASRGAELAHARLLCRKVLLSRPLGSRSTSRAAFTHVLVFGRGPGLDPRLPDILPDVLAEPGEATWVRGLGARAAQDLVAYIQRYAPATTTIVDPFCGEGMALAAANARGLDAVGVERNRKRAEAARTLQLLDPG